MIWRDLLTAMLPEHVLLAGILLLLGREIVTGRERGGFVSAVAVLLGALLAACWLYSIDYIGAPFFGHYSSGPDASL
ncbi:MAG: hypothetical protein KBE42_01615, partial [Steroidobacteraceae bacterium]|nr:hypothetical protein [Steroidobacteraceae bacterium]